MTNARACVPATLALLALCAGMAHAKTFTVTVSAPAGPCRYVPVSVLLPAGTPANRCVLLQDGKPVTAQAQPVKGGVELTWIVPEIASGQAVRYEVSTSRQPEGFRPSASRPAVQMERKGANLDILVDGQPFATYDATTGPNKPYFYPLYGPDGKLMVRRYPLEKVPGETTDHPHHRGLWFTHGAVNGVDYWSEEKNTGKTVNRAYKDVVSGPVYGQFRATTDWIDPSGKKVATDEREVRVYNVPDGRLMDFTVAIKPAAGPLVFGDTKEGSFGLRIPDSIRPESGGHIVNSEGLTDGKTWAQRAQWVDYYGPVGGETVGVAIIDHPSNLRHPTYWHVRDYGLFAVNPFGIHDFVKGQPAGAGNYTLAADGTLTFRYRIFLHRGTTDEARIAELANAYIHPPTATVK